MTNEKGWKTASLQLLACCKAMSRIVADLIPAQYVLLLHTIGRFEHHEAFRVEFQIAIVCPVSLISCLIGH